MSDTSLPVIVRFDTQADRIAFTPTPGIPEQLYIWLDSDDQPNSYYWDGAAWQPFASGTSSGGDVTGPSGATTGNIAVFADTTGKVIADGAMSIADIVALITANTAINQLTGDVTAGPGGGSQVATIANNAVTTVKILDANVTDAKISNRTALSVFGRASNSAGVGADIVAGTNDTLLAQTGNVLAWQQLTVGMIPNAIITPAKLTTAGKTLSRGITVDGGGSVITTGVKGYLRVPIACTISRWSLMADLAGNVDFDIFADAPGSTYPPTTSIVGGDGPELVGADFADDTVMTGWTLTLAAGDVLGFEVLNTPPTVMTRVTLQLDLVTT